jgi:hypothetical protein
VLLFTIDIPVVPGKSRSGRLRADYPGNRVTLPSWRTLRRRKRDARSRGATRSGHDTSSSSTGRLNGLLAIVAIVVLVVISAVTARVWAGQLAMRSGVGAENAAPNAGAGSAVVHDDACNMLSNAGSAIVHDDAWNRPRSDEVHPWVNLRDDEGNVHRVRVH